MQDKTKVEIRDSDYCPESVMGKMVKNRSEFANQKTPISFYLQVKSLSKRDRFVWTEVMKVTNQT